jgi:hypothetical protein
MSYAILKKLIGEVEFLEFLIKTFEMFPQTTKMIYENKKAIS